METEIFEHFPIFDSHAHYTDERFEREYAGGTHALLTELFKSGQVGYIMNIATDPENALKVVEMAKRYENMYAAVGVHPADIEESPLPMEEQLDIIERLLADKEANKIKAIGEIGLDYYWHPEQKDSQIEFYRAQIEMALRHSLPVVIHDREAHGDCFDITTEYKGLRGIFHCYSGSAEMAKELSRRGFYVSFAGPVTFKNARKAVEAAEAVPIERMLMETDCPYLAPVPYRGKLNHSGRSIETAKALAEIKGVTVDELIRITSQNAKDIFGIV